MTAPLIEYRVRQISRYIVTRFERGEIQADGTASRACGSTGRGEYDNEQTAYEVAYALCKADHERLGWPIGDERIPYPERPSERILVNIVGKRSYQPPPNLPAIRD